MEIFSALTEVSKLTYVEVLKHIFETKIQMQHFLKMTLQKLQHVRGEAKNNMADFGLFGWSFGGVGTTGGVYFWFASGIVLGFFTITFLYTTVI